MYHITVTGTVLLSALVRLCRHHKVTHTSILDNRHSFSHSSGGYKPMIKVLANLISD